MTFQNIETALAQRLAALVLTPALPIAWENKDFPAVGSYLEFRHAPTTRVDDTTDGSGASQIGIALITVVTPRDTFTNAALVTAQAIANWFPKGLRLAIAGGNVLIYAPTLPASGFVDGRNWRLPVRVFYLTELV